LQTRPEKDEQIARAVAGCVKRKNEKPGPKGNEANEVEMRLRSSKRKPPCSRRGQEAVLGRPQHGADERPAGVVIPNPPPHLGGYGATGPGLAVRRNALRVAQTHS